MIPQDILETIEAYLEGTLTGADRSDFEARLQRDPDLAAQVLLIKDIDRAMSDQVTLDFQKLVQSEGNAFQQKEVSKEKQIKKIGRWRFLTGIAASLLVLVLCTFLFWKMNSAEPPSGNALFAQHFETHTLNPSIRSNEAVETSSFLAAVEQYKAKDFSAAALTFQQLAANDQQDVILSFCLANAYLNQTPPQLSLAQAEFQKVIAEGQSVYVARAKWYLALIYLKNDATSEAVVLLKELAQSSNNLGEQAAAVLKDLGL